MFIRKTWRQSHHQLLRKFDSTFTPRWESVIKGSESKYWYVCIATNFENCDAISVWMCWESNLLDICLILALNSESFSISIWYQIFTYSLYIQLYYITYWCNVKYITVMLQMNLFPSQCVSNGITNMYVKSYRKQTKWWYKDYDFNGGYLYSIKVV